MCEKQAFFLLFLNMSLFLFFNIPQVIHFLPMHVNQQSRPLLNKVVDKEMRCLAECQQILREMLIVFQYFGISPDLYIIAKYDFLIVNFTILTSPFVH